MKAPTNGFPANSGEGEKKIINSELWHACAGPLVSLPPIGSLVVYFPQGHSEQVAASMQKDTDCVPSYPNLPSKLICMLHNVTLHADPETDEVYAQMTLQPVTKYDKDALLASDLGLKQNKQPSEFFCKTLTASDTSTHGGFSVPRRAAEKLFPPLDFSLQPPAQELTARDLHDNMWTFRHIYRGQPKRHLLTTGWSVFVSTKRLFAGDSVLFIRDEKSQFMLGIRRANRQQPTLSSSVISSDSMHIGILAAAAHAAANNSPFTIFYNPRASPREFVIPIAKYNNAMYTQASPGMRFRMTFETEDSGVRRYMGTITAISDLDPVRWKGSQWRNIQVGWDESTAGDRPSRVSLWEIEPVVTPFYLCPPPFFRPKFPKQPGCPDDESDMENALKRGMPWLDDFGMKDAATSVFPGMSLVQWMSMQQNNQFPHSGFFPSMMSSTALHNALVTDDPTKLLSFQNHASSLASIQFNKANQQNQTHPLQPPTVTWPQHHQHQQLLQNPISMQQQQQSSQLLQQQSLQQSSQQTSLQQQSQQMQRQHFQQMQPHAQQHFQQMQPHPQQQTVQQQQQQQQAHLVQPQQAPQVPQQHQQPQSRPQPQMQSQQQPQNVISQAPVSNGVVSASQIPAQKPLQPVMSSMIQKQVATSHDQNQQVGSSRNQYHVVSSEEMQFQQQLEPPSTFRQKSQGSRSQLQQSPTHMLQQHNASQRPQEIPQVLQSSQSHQSLVEHQLQLQMLQRMQQQQLSHQALQKQHQQSQIAPAVSSLQPQVPQHLHQPNQHSFPQPVLQHQLSTASQTQQYTVNQLQTQPNPLTTVRAQSGLTDGDAPSCSTSPSTNYCQVSSNLLNKKHEGLAGDFNFEQANLDQEFQIKADTQVKHELPNSKVPDPLKYRCTVTDHMEASSSATSYSLDANNFLSNFSLPTLLDGDDQSHSRNSISFVANTEGLTPDTLMTRGYDSAKDLQNLFSNYDRTPRTELSTAAISFGVPNMSFKPGCSGDISINDTGVIGTGMWSNQTQRMRTYTKVQKRGSVGRSIDVTRYQGYDELKRDLARMFGIEGQLDDPQRAEWKLVYVDHENDILLVGDDPWEEFVSCVQSIKILSSAEVQQMSLDGDLGNVVIPNQACSGSDSGNAWRGNYDDTSAVSFNR